MRRADFSYSLPDELIARHPLPERAASRLLALDGGSGALRDLMFRDLSTLLRAGDLLVLNDTRVLPARLHGCKASGGSCEILLERILGERRILAQARASKGFRTGTEVLFADGARAAVVARCEDLYEFEFDRPALPYFESQGSMPLPPYIGREPDASDRERYQTVYAAEPGAIAAPTAGLHFDKPTLARLATDGVAIARLTLHVGAGTFQPLRVDEIEGHRMHSERFRVPPETVVAVESARHRGGRVRGGGSIVRDARAARRGRHGGARASRTIEIGRAHV